MVVVLALAGSAISLAVQVGSMTDRPWDDLRAATRAADLIVSSRTEPDLAKIRAVPGVEAVGPVVRSRLLRATVDGTEVAVALGATEGDPTTAELERLYLVSGAWTPGQVVLERTFARALGATTGSLISLPLGRGGVVEMTVSGLVATTLVPTYPATAPGRAFVDTPSLQAVAAGPQDHVVGDAARSLGRARHRVQDPSGDRRAGGHHPLGGDPPGIHR